jgi:hypothetical protein
MMWSRKMKVAVLAGLLSSASSLAMAAPMGHNSGSMSGGCGMGGMGGGRGMMGRGMAGGMMSHGMGGMMGRGMGGGMTPHGQGGGMMGGMGRGMMMTHGNGGGMMSGGGMGGGMADMRQAHSLLANHDSIRRSVRKLPNGVETITTSADPKVAALLPEHVIAMQSRLKNGQVIRGFDPLFAELFQNASKIDLQIEGRPDGVRVVETSGDPYVVKLIQAHAEAVNGFVRDGMAGMHRTHAVPAR